MPPYIDDMTPFELSRLKWKDRLRAMKRRESREANEGQVLCAYCNCDLSHIQIHLSHIVPSSLGGETDQANVVLSCNECIRAKNERSLEAWLFRLRSQAKGVMRLLTDPPRSDIPKS